MLLSINTKFCSILTDLKIKCDSVPLLFLSSGESAPEQPHHVGTENWTTCAKPKVKDSEWLNTNGHVKKEGRIYQKYFDNIQTNYIFISVYIIQYGIPMKSLSERVLTIDKNIFFQFRCGHDI